MGGWNLYTGKQKNILEQNNSIFYKWQLYLFLQGGRQVGTCSLLQKAEKNIHLPDNTAQLPSCKNISHFLPKAGEQ